jgi:hypothetical protein
MGDAFSTQPARIAANLFIHSPWASILLFNAGIPA